VAGGVDCCSKGSQRKIGERGEGRGFGGDGEEGKGFATVSGKGGAM